MLMRKLAPHDHFAPSLHDYYIANKDGDIESDDQNVYKSTDNDF